jgi:exosortase
MLTLPIFAAGLTLILFNYETLRQAAFPIAFLALLTPLPEGILYALNSTLSTTTSQASNGIITALGIPSTLSTEYANPTITITRPDNTPIKFTIGTACSGVYPLIGFLIFAVFVAYITRTKLWKKLAILLVSIPLIYALSIIRLTTILLIGYYQGEQLALQIFHLLGGWMLILIGTLILLTTTEKTLKIKTFTKSQPPTPCPQCNPTPPNLLHNFCPNCGRLLKYPKVPLKKRDVARIATIAIAIALLLTIQAPIFALTEGPAQIIIQTPTGEQGNTQILPQISSYTLTFISRDKDFEHEAEQDASLLYAYMPTDKTKETVSVSVEIAQTRSSLHSWEVCLITWPQTHGYQPTVTQLDLRDIQILQNPPIIARIFAFQYTKYNQTQLVIYWYEGSTFITNDAAQQKHVKISLITYPDTSENITEAENYLIPFATAIAGYWEPIKTWTQIALIISKNGTTLASVSSAAVALILLYVAIRKTREKKNATRIYQKLSEHHQQIIKTVQQTQKETTPTTNNITEKYNKLTQKPITTSELVKELDQAAKTGLIKNKIANQKDEPIQTWKTNLLSNTA